MALALVTITQSILWWISVVYRPLAWVIPTLQRGPQGLDIQRLHQGTQTLQEATRNLREAIQLHSQVCLELSIERLSRLTLGRSTKLLRALGSFKQ